jgi:hypothetical protein
MFSRKPKEVPDASFGSSSPEAILCEGPVGATGALTAGIPVGENVEEARQSRTSNHPALRKSTQILDTRRDDSGK